MSGAAAGRARVTLTGAAAGRSLPAWLARLLAPTAGAPVPEPKAPRGAPPPAANWAALEQVVRERRLDLDTLLRRVVDEAAATVGAERATLYLHDQAQGELVSRAGHLPELPEIRLRVGEGIAGEVARTGRLLRVPSASDDRRFAARVDAATGYTTRCVLAVPLGPPPHIGVLQAINKRAGTFSAEDERTLQGLAVEVARLIGLTSLGGQLRTPRPRPLRFGFNQLVGEAPAMQEVFARVAQAAPTEASVLVRGESGVGKELVARAVHDNSARAAGPFVVVDLSALPESLLESELFGHRKGAFTGAVRDAPGRVSEASGGTLFLDEVGELPLPMQSRLLRLLQERRYHPVGDSRPREADVRFIFATHQPLEALVEERRFRQDLYYRLRVIEITVPPLRERGEADLDHLVTYLLDRLGERHRRPGRQLSPAARARLLAWRWPGNVRELEHALEAALVIAPGPLLEVEHLPGPLQARPSAAAAAHFVSPLRPLAEVEAAYVAWALAQVGGNKSEAARLLEIGRNTLQRKLDGGEEGGA